MYSALCCICKYADKNLLTNNTLEIVLCQYRAAEGRGTACMAALPSAVRMLSGMPDEFAGGDVPGFAALWRAHHVEHGSGGIDHQVIDDTAHARKLLRNLGGGGLLLGVPHGAAEANNAKLGIDSDGQTACTLVLAKCVSNLGRQGIIADQIILDLQQPLYSRNLVAGQFAAQGAGDIALHVEHAVEDSHTHPFQVDVQEAEIEDNLVNLALKLAIGAIWRQRLEPGGIDGDCNLTRLKRTHVLLAQQRIAARQQITRDNIGQFSAAGLNR